ncbi:MAG TPA: GNAT family N-acetyltransferase [Herpetosiphonaceae bacterium]|nr:GNAT family N-acetyltransferase [Herpetosiphonaceae bacterium]
MLQTDRLTLIPCTREHLTAFLRDPAELAGLLQVTIPPDFPVFPGGFAYWADRLSAEPIHASWNEWLFVDRAQRIVVGDGGFYGAPSAEGEVEIGYAILPAYQGQGLATEAAAGLVAWAFRDPAVTAVRATTLATGTESIRVLTKLGMEAAGTVEDPDDGPLIHWRLPRPSTPPSGRRS